MSPSPADGRPGDLDLYLLGEGRHRRLWEVLGGRLLPGGGASFSVWAPNARRVVVHGDWAGWVPDRGAVMEPLGTSGVWWATVPAARDGQTYKFEIVGVDGRATMRAAPMALAAEVPPSTASVPEVVST